MEQKSRSNNQTTKLNKQLHKSKMNQNLDLDNCRKASSVKAHSLPEPSPGESTSTSCLKQNNEPLIHLVQQLAIVSSRYLGDASL